MNVATENFYHMFCLHTINNGHRQIEKKIGLTMTKYITLSKRSNEASDYEWASEFSVNSLIC